MVFVIFEVTIKKGCMDSYLDLAAKLKGELVKSGCTFFHKKAGTHIKINIEFGNEEGQIPINEIVKKTEEYISDRK